MTRLLAIVIFLPSLAMANSYRDSLEDAADSLESAAKATKRGDNRCKSMAVNLTTAADDVESIFLGTTPRRVAEIQSIVAGLQATAAKVNCPQKVADRIARAAGELNNARGALPAWEGRRHHGRDDDDDDNRNSPPPPSGRALEVTLGDLRVVYGQQVQGESGVRVEIGSVNFRNIGRTPFYFGGRLRAAQGNDWSEWLTSAQYTAPQDPYQWANPYVQWFPARVLRANDRGGGHFVARISVFDLNRNELAFKEVPIELVGGGTPGPSQPPPPSGREAPPAVVARDCGTNPDPGCDMQRQGNWAMDRDGFAGFYDSLKRTPSDLTRIDMCRSVLANNWVTAKQLGMILDLFNSDLVRLDAAKVAAPHTVNPTHALGLSTKFRSSLLQADFTRLMSGQR